MSRRRVHVAMTLMFAATCAVVATNGCAASGTKPTLSAGTGGAAQASSGTGGTSHASTGTGNGEGGSITLNFDAGDASADATEDGDGAVPCGSKCGPVELCDPAHLGLDDNCNGVVDEGCTCNPGSVHWCFAGDPQYHNTPGCYDGTEVCGEIGIWGPCVGGVNAAPPDNCYLNDTSACHAITAVPYATTDLKTGTGTFSANAVAGSESYTVTCPTGVSQCPGVTAPPNYEAIQSGQYTVTYSKMVSGDPNALTCVFPLIVGAPGLRVELSWEHHLTDDGVDLDLHLHEPLNTQPWAVSPGAPQDCNWSSCKFATISTGLPPAPQWFPTSNVVPQPVNWDLDTTNVSNNTCYNDPRGVGAMWQAYDKGCHNPRLDVDDITCNYAITNPNNPNFCVPENINVDYPPNKQWARIGVHYYWNHDETYDVHPEVKVFCNGELSANLGPQGFYVPASPVTFEASDGAGAGTGNRFWLVADVAFTTDSCGTTSCTVQPIYSNPTNKTPLFSLDTAVKALFAPAWPPPPQ